MRGLNKCFYADLQANLSNPTTSLTEEDGRNRQVELPLKEVQQTWIFSQIGQEIGLDKGRITEVIV